MPPKTITAEPIKRRVSRRSPKMRKAQTTEKTIESLKIALT